MNQHWFQVMEGRRHFCSTDLCSLIEASPALALHRNGNSLVGCERCEGKKSSSHADNVFIKYILGPPS